MFYIGSVGGTGVFRIRAVIGLWGLWFVSGFAAFCQDFAMRRHLLQK